MANAYFYSNIAVPTTLSGNINNSVGSCTVASTTGWPGSTPYIVSIDYATANEELVKVTNNAAGTLTITRGFGGTSAVSHSTGAVVRHVYNAQDATDFRTHEAALTGVHGVAGALVGTTDSQTLTNKTLTSPAISAPTITGGGSLSGTFSGTPTFSGAIVLSGGPNISTGGNLSGTFTGSPTWSGNPTFSGNPSFTGTPTWTGKLASQPPAASTNVVSTNVNAADSFDRWRLYGDGKQEWGSGSIARDVNLYRSGVGVLQTDNAFTGVGTLTSAPTSTSVDGLAANLPTSTTGDLLNLRVNSAIQAAMGSDGQFRIYGGNAPTTYTPTVTNGGSVTWTTRTGYYWRLGKMVYFVAALIVNVAGSGTGVLSVTTPTNIDRTTRQVFHSVGEGVGINGHGYAVAFTGGTNNTIDRIRSYDGQNLTGADLLAAGNITIQGWYREA